MEKTEGCECWWCGDALNDDEAIHTKDGCLCEQCRAYLASVGDVDLTIPAIRIVKEW